MKMVSKGSSFPESNRAKIPAMLKNMPRNGGTTLRMRRYNPLATALVPLGNSGVTPPAQNLTAIDIDATISFYGTYVILKIVEDLKSLVIDLESRWADKAQA